MEEKCERESKKNESQLPDYYYEKFKNAVDELEHFFDRIAKRFTSEDYKSLVEGVNNLESLYKALVEDLRNEGPDKTRLEQIAHITQLAHELSKIKTDDDEIKLQCRSILYGSLFYRLRRIDKSYKPYNRFFGNWLGTAADNSALNQAIERITKLAFLGDAENLLDDLTLYNTCLAYQNYLEQDDIEVGNRKRSFTKVSARFPYIKNDPEFFGKLGRLIKAAKPVAMILQAQLNYIDFIMAVKKKLDFNDKALKQSLMSLASSLTEKLKSCDSLDAEAIMDFFYASNPSDLLIQRFAVILNPAFIVKKTNDLKDDDEDEFSVEELVRYVKDQSDYINHHVLLGACMLSLTRCNTPEREYLRDTLINALASQGKNPLDKKASERAYKALQKFLSFQENREFMVKQFDPHSSPWIAWGSFDLLAKYLTNQINDLMKVDDNIYSFRM